MMILAKLQRAMCLPLALLFVQSAWAASPATRVSGETGALSIQTDKGSADVYADSRALIIGESHYTAASWQSLTSIISEAGKVDAALRAQGFTTTVAFNQSGVQLERLLKNFLSANVNHDTRLIVYFAGHGWTDDQSGGFVVPVDAPGEGEKDFRASVIGMDDILNWSYGSNAKHILFIFDSCFSGAVFEKRSNLRPGRLFVDDIDRDVREIITSGSATDSVPAVSDFARLLTQGLSGDADLYPDGIITGSELGYWLRAKVSSLGKQTPQFGTSPQTRYEAGDLIVGVVGSRAGAPDNLPIPSHPSDKGQRAAQLRSLGVPDRPTASAFTSVEVKYSRKLVDGDKVDDALNHAGIPFTQVRQLEGYPEPVNSIVCSSDAPLPAVKQLASTLVEGGVKIRAIYTQTGLPSRFIAINTQPAPVTLRSPLTVGQINAMRNCSLINKENE